MEDKNLLETLTDREIDQLLAYTVPYTEENRNNIKDKFIRQAVLAQPAAATVPTALKPRKHSTRKWLALAALITLLTTATLAYAQGFDFSRIYHLVFGEKFETVEPYLEPLTEQTEPENVIQSEYDGIVLKLISIINDGDALRIFATMQDTTGGNRLSESLTFDSWGLSQGQGGNVEVVDYDWETRTAALLITSLGGEQEGSATLSMNSFTTSRETIEGLKESLNLYDLLQTHTPQPMSQDRVWGPGLGRVGAMIAAEHPDEREYQLNYPADGEVLQFDELGLTFDNIDWAYVSNLGFLDDGLHIQTCKLTDESFVTGIRLVNSRDEVVFDDALILQFIDYEDRYGPTPDSEESHGIYAEWIFEGIKDVEQLKGLNLVIDVWQAGSVIEGNWEFSFEIPEKVTTEFAVSEAVTINSEQIKVDTIALSPLGVTLELPENIASRYQHKDYATVIYDDGTIVILSEAYIGGYGDQSTLKFGGELIEIEKVTSIQINDDFEVVIR